MTSVVIHPNGSPQNYVPNLQLQNQGGCVLVHAIPGRVRFRVPKASLDPKYAKRLQKMLESAPGVVRARVNPAAASAVITYAGQTDSEMKLRLARLIQDSIAAQPTPAPIVPASVVKGSPERLAEHPAEHLAVAQTESPIGTAAADSTNEQFDWRDLRLSMLATLLATLRMRVPMIPQIVVAGMVAAAALPVVKRAVLSVVQERKLNIDCLDLLAITASASQRDWLTPALLLLLQEVGDAIRDRTARASASQAADLLDSLGHSAWVQLANSEVKQVPVSEVQVGDTVIVYPGEQIPVDGTILSGEASIEQQRLTGESMPVVRRVGETVFAATLVRSGKLHIKTERIGANTRAGATIALVKQAPVYETRMENYAAQIADRAILPAIALAGVTWVITRDSTRVASILTLDFVTGIRLAVPTTFLAAINHAARHGILIRSGRTLEQLAKVDAIVFDKTGTLTQGNIQIVAINVASHHHSSERLLQLAAAAEQRITHPLAEAIVHHTKTQGIKIPARRDVNFEVGLGVRAFLASGEVVLVGSERFLKQENIVTNQTDHTGGALMYVACNGEFIGTLRYDDPLRPDAQIILKKLQSRYGMEIHMLTGDNYDHAITVANKLGMVSDQVHADAFPEMKAKLVRQLHDSGKVVAFVGDGLNDAAALAYADASVSFASGSDVARETADVVLMNDHLWSLLDAIAIAKETQQITQENIVLSVAPNVVALGLATFVGLNPLIAALIHNGSAIAAGFNGLRPLLVHRYTEPQKMYKAEAKQTTATLD